MEEIRDIQSRITENKFKLKQIEESLSKSLEYIKENLDSYLNMKLITEEQSEYFKQLNVDYIKSSDMTEFKEIINYIMEVEKTIEAHLDKIAKDIDELKIM